MSKVVRYKNVSRAPLLRGSWNNGSNAGPRALNLNNAPSNRNSNIGFRSALKQRQKRYLYGDSDRAQLNGLYTLSRVLEYGWRTFSSKFTDRQGAQYA